MTAIKSLMDSKILRLSNAQLTACLAAVSYEDALQTYIELNDRRDQLCLDLRAEFPEVGTGIMGLTPDHIKAQPAYIEAKKKERHGV